MWQGRGQYGDGVDTRNMRWRVLKCPAPTHTQATTCEASPFPDNMRGRSSDILYSVMSILRVLRARRVLVRIACLALFLAGSNFCLLSAWGGNVSMACLTLPGAATQAPARCHHCAPAPSSRAGHESGRSCCPDPVVTPTSIALDRGDMAAIPAAEMDLAAVTPQPTSAWHGHRASSDGRPPTRLAGAPLSVRAPPLA